MKKTAKEVQSDIIAMLKGSDLALLADGGIYRNGYRPRDSKKEDIVVVFTAGLTNQIQTGVVTIHIYVPDIECEGVMVENGARTALFEREAEKWVESLTCGRSNYKFSLQNTITTIDVDEIQQHIVVIMLKYEFFE